MGKENELIEAARSGNFATVQKYIVPKNKISVLQTLSKLPHINCQDINGGTSLHYAALNNHKNIVELLLQHKALANIPDNKGCFPLHLAAWAGNTSICELILNCETSHANLNVQNLDGDTALHLSAHHGHLDIVNLLLKYSASPILRNLRNELPLDLAITYGREDIVKAFLTYENHLKLYHWFCEYDVPKPRRINQRNGETDLARRESFTFGSDDTKRGGSKTRTLPSPIHLAARNGRLAIMKLLLSSDFDINTITKEGSALHESIVHGRKQIFSLLLEYGINTSLKDDMGRTALDLLKEINTPIIEELKKIYYKKYNTANKNNYFTNDSPPESIYSNIIPSSHQNFRDVRSSLSSNQSSLFGSTQNSSIDLDLDSLHDFTKIPGKLEHKSNNASNDVPKKPPRRKAGERLKHTQSVSTHNKPSLTYLNEKGIKKPDSLNLKDIFGQFSPPSIITKKSSCNSNTSSSYVSNNYTHNSINYPNDLTYSYISSSNNNDTDNFLQTSTFENSILVMEDDKPKETILAQNQGLFFANNNGQLFSPSKSNTFTQQNLLVNTDNTEKLLDNLPTPDHAPPSPATAIKGIQSHINNLSFIEHHDSCDAITFTDPFDIQILEKANIKHPLQDISNGDNDKSSNYLDNGEDIDLMDNDEMDKEIIYKSELRSKHKKILAHNFPVFKNHELILDSELRSLASLETHHQIYEPVGGLNKKNVSGSQIFDEAEEWAQIEDLLLLSLSGGINSDDLVKEFDEKMSFVFSQKSVSDEDMTIGSLLKSIELQEYEKLLIPHGFDDVHFINSEIMDDDDLQEIGILVYNHRQKILDACKKLNYAEKRTDFSNLNDWLEYLNLASYQQQFLLNGFHQISDIHSLWDFHLNSLLGIELIGHRKRIIWSIKNMQAKDRFSNHPVIFFNRSVKSPFTEISLYKDYSNLNQISQIHKSNELNTSQVNDFDISKIKSRFEIKDILLTLSCDFIVQYIGSIEVHELNDSNISKRTISLIKNNTQDIDVFPSIQLSISFSTVSFSHYEDKTLIYKHSVGDVFCACQDPTDICYFAYVSRHPSTGQHFCHLFFANNTTQSTEIILTLGEAFDLAYEKAQKDKLAQKPINENEHIIDSDHILDNITDDLLELGRRVTIL